MLKVLGVEDLVEEGEMKGQHEGETVLSLLREIRGYLKILCEQSLKKSPKADTGSNCGSERGDAIMDDNTDTKTYVDVAVNGLTLSASGKDTNGGTNKTTSKRHHGANHGATTQEQPFQRVQRKKHGKEGSEKPLAEKKGRKTLDPLAPPTVLFFGLLRDVDSDQWRWELKPKVTEALYETYGIDTRVQEPLYRRNGGKRYRDERGGT